MYTVLGTFAAGSCVTYINDPALRALCCLRPTDEEEVAVHGQQPVHTNVISADETLELEEHNIYRSLYCVESHWKRLHTTYHITYHIRISLNACIARSQGSNVLESKSLLCAFITRPQIYYHNLFKDKLMENTGQCFIHEISQVGHTV